MKTPSTRSVRRLRGPGPRRFWFGIPVLLLLVSWLPAQNGEQPTQDPEEVLAAIDGRVYRPKEKGLEAFRFRMDMGRQATGLLEKELKGIYMEVAHRRPKAWRFRLVDQDGKALAEEPAFFATEQGKSLRAAWESNLKTMSLQFLVGVGWQERYRDYYKQMKRYLVNDKVEYRITMNPKVKAGSSTVVLKVASGLPRELTQIDDQGHRYVAYFVFEPREELDGLHLLTGTKHEVDGVEAMEEAYEYLTRDKFVLLGKVTRLVSQGEIRAQTFSYEGLEVNPDFPEGWFGKADETAESKPTIERAPEENDAEPAGK
ncbi:MAG: hypothetical protein H6807_14340 [Planctomycetes bacterium]|nr:hypothetical protein [Planctomycetota bacterium]